MKTMQLHVLLIIGLFFPVLSWSQNAVATQKAAEVAVKDNLDDLYIHFHTHPELSFYEKETSERLASELKAAGCDEVTTEVGGYGVVGVMRNGPGKTVLVRADMDALPVQEETGVPYASAVTTTDQAGNAVPVMHACGHDVHMTSLVGTAQLLEATKSQWSGTVVFIGQPAEERAGGANAMLADGLFERFPVPDYAVALHASASLPAGTVGFVSGYAMANVNMVDITVKGQGGHGAYPHTTKDPIVLAARLITAFQTIVSREISPLEPAVLTVGSIHGGTKGNIIGNEVRLELTLRSYDDGVRTQLIESIKRICAGEAVAAGLPDELWPVVEVLNEETPSVYNDPELSARAANALRELLGDDQVKELTPVMGGEDFARYGRTEHDIPIFLYWLGAVPKDKWKRAQEKDEKLPSLHSSKFYPEKVPTLTTGVSSMTHIVHHLLGKH